MSTRRRQYRQLGTMEKMIYETCGPDALVAWWAERRDVYNAKRRDMRDERRRRIVALWEEDSSLGSWRLSAILGVTIRQIWRDRAYLRDELGITPQRDD